MATVMVVDDNQFMRKHLADTLKEQGFEVCLAEDGNQAVQVYRSARPSVALMDVVMPNKDGLQALAEIRQFDPQARVIMLTALDQQAVATQAVQLGAKDFLTKPVVTEWLMQSLQRVLR